MSKLQQKYKQRRILFLTNYPSPYRVDFFNELGRQGEIDLTVVFLELSSEQTHRSADWFHEDYVNFKAVFANRRFSLPKGFFICPEVITIIKQGFDYVIIGGVSYPSSMLAMEYMRRQHIPYWIEGDGAFAKNGRGFKEKIKKHFISGAEGWFSTSAELDKYYLQYGARPSGIVRYPFTSLFEKDILPEPVLSRKKAALRQELQLAKGPLVLTVGQFIPRKGFDVLLSCADLMRDIIFIFIGGKPTEEYLAVQKEKQLANVHFIGFQKKKELWTYYQAADLFVLPTREDIWGLVINEAMANGLPVVTTDRCIAGLELVRNGENGYIVPAGDVEATAEAIRKTLAANAGEMGKRSLEIIRDYTIEKMTEAHAETLIWKNEKD